MDTLADCMMYHLKPVQVENKIELNFLVCCLCDMHYRCLGVNLSVAQVFSHNHLCLGASYFVVNCINAMEHLGMPAFQCSANVWQVDKMLPNAFRGGIQQKPITVEVCYSFTNTLFFPHPHLKSSIHSLLAGWPKSGQRHCFFLLVKCLTGASLSAFCALIQ